MVYIGRAKYKVNLIHANSLKDRRKVAQRVRDFLKSKYNASIKLIYEEHIRHFEVYVCLVSDDRDYLHLVIDEIHAWLDEDASLVASCEYDVTHFFDNTI